MHLHHSPPPPPTIALGTPLGKLPTAQRPLAHMLRQVRCAQWHSRQHATGFGYSAGLCYLAVIGTSNVVQEAAMQRARSNSDTNRGWTVIAISNFVPIRRTGTPSPTRLTSSPVSFITPGVSAMGPGAIPTHLHRMLCLIIGSHTRTAGRRKRSDAGMNGGTEA